MQQLFLKKHEDRRLRAGHLWIFSNEVDVKRSPLTAFAPGEAAQVCAADGRTIGTAYVNPASLIAARIVSRKADEPLDAALIKKRLERALQLRETLFDVPFYRLCHGEGDWLPGLVLDRYGDVFSAQITTAGMEAQKDALLEVLGELFTPKAVLLRNDVGVRTMENLPLLVETGMGTVPDEIEVRESGAAFTVSLAEGQKTGWFYDQRPNRVEAAKYAKGKKDAEQGLNAYRRVNDLGLQLVENGGILTSCSCSHHLEAEALRRLIAQCAAKRGLNTQLLYQGFQGPDHPVHPSMPETAYLKVFILRVWKD